MKPAKVRISGTLANGWKCKCGEIVIDTEDAQRLLYLNKIKKGLIKGKVTQTGNSLAIRIPMAFANAYHLIKGKEITLVPKDKNTIELQVPA